jgi:rhamnose transport system permease protein
MSEGRKTAGVWLSRHRSDLALIGLLVIVGLIFSLIAPNFATASTLLSATRRAVEIGLLAPGMSVVIASGGIDLSVGSTMALSSVVLGYSFAAGAPLAAGVVIAMVTAILCGALNGVFVSVFRIHPLVVTLGTLALYSGIAIGISRGGGYSLFPESFLYFGQFYLGGVVPAQIVAWAVIAVIMHVLASRTAWGRRVLALGTNTTAAWFSGIRVRRLVLSIYTLSGLLAGIATLIFTSRVFSARGDVGSGFMLMSIAAVVVGGAPIQGGAISIFRTSVAVLIVAMVPDGLTLAGVNTNWQFPVIGIIMILAVAINQSLRDHVEVDQVDVAEPVPEGATVTTRA